MLDKNIKKVILVCAGILLVVLSFAEFAETDDNYADTTELESLICSIDGVENASVVYYYSKEDSSEVLDGIAIIYKGRQDYAVTESIYELINALYDIPYNRIYVSH